MSHNTLREVGLLLQRWPETGWNHKTPLYSYPEAGLFYFSFYSLFHLETKVVSRMLVWEWKFYLVVRAVPAHRGYGNPTLSRKLTILITNNGQSRCWLIGRSRQGMGHRCFWFEVKRAVQMLFALKFIKYAILIIRIFGNYTELSGQESYWHLTVFL